MNYTENFQLPQWVEDDRILRTDFNQMCAKIDVALANNAQASQENDKYAWEGLLRLLRLDVSRQWPELDQTKMFLENGVLYNPLYRQSHADTLDGLTWSVDRGISLQHGDELDQGLLQNSCIDCWPGKLDGAPGSENASSLYRFTAPCSCVMRGWTLFLVPTFSAQNQNLTVMFDITAEKRSNGVFTQIYASSQLVEQTGTASARLEIPVTVNIPLEASAEYRLKISIRDGYDNVTVPGRFGFIVDLNNPSSPSMGYTDHSAFQLESPAVSSGTHTRLLNPEGNASHGLLMLHYCGGDQNSGLTPYLGGQPMKHIHRAQRHPSLDAELYWEDWFSCAGSYNRATELKIQFKPVAGDEVRLLRYAAALM